MTAYERAILTIAAATIATIRERLRKRGRYGPLADLLRDSENDLRAITEAEMMPVVRMEDVA